MLTDLLGPVWAPPPPVEACTVPEQPATAAIQYRAECPGCRIALVADAYARPDGLYRWTPDGAEPREISAVEAVRIVATDAGDTALLAAMARWELDRNGIDR